MTKLLNIVKRGAGKSPKSTDISNKRNSDIPILRVSDEEEEDENDVMRDMMGRIVEEEDEEEEDEGEKGEGEEYESMPLKDEDFEKV